MALVLTKTSDKINVFPGDIVTYKVTVKNTNPALSETNIIFTDIIPDGATFLKDSFSINNAIQLEKNPNSGVAISNIASGATTTVAYKVKVDNQPAPVQFTNKAQAVSTLEGTTTEETYLSNELTVNVSVVDIFKSVDKVNVSLTEEITYTIIINNIGAVELINPILKDIVPQCLSFVPGSFSVNGVLDTNADPNKGVNFENILPGQILTITFKAKVTCIPCPPKFINIAMLNYGIEINPNGEIANNRITSNKTVTTASISSFKQLSREEYVKIPVQKPDVEEILNTLVDIKITDKKVIKTPVGTSLEGQKLTGFKLIVEGILNQKIEYIAADKEQSVHAAHFKVPFSTFIVLPSNFVEGTPVSVEGNVEDIYTKLIDKRTIFKNITFIVYAKYTL